MSDMDRFDQQGNGSSNGNSNPQQESPKQESAGGYTYGGQNNGWNQGAAPGQSDQSNQYSQTNPYGNWSNGAANNPYANMQNNKENVGPGEYQWNFEEYDSQNKKNHRAPKRKKGGVIVFSVLMALVLVIGAGSVAGFGVYNYLKQNDQQSQNPSSPNQGAGDTSQPDSGNVQLSIKESPSSTETDPVTADGKLTTGQISKKVGPSIVGIINYMNPTAMTSTSSTVSGSGIIISADGYIVTNAHVVADSVGLKVVLSNGEEFEARLVGSDAQTDLAVLKIESDTALAYAEFGDSSKVEVGDKAVAIGNPGGLTLSGSVTQGIISAVDRPISSSDGGQTMNCLQTDAAINPGNSGGALINEYGLVIGINSSKIAATDYEGIGFAIPTNEAKPIIEDLINYGKVTGRVKIGVTLKQVDVVLARMNNLPTGMMIMSTEEGTDIVNKAIPGDIITAIDGQTVETFSDITDIIEGKKPGDVITVSIFRRTQGQRDKTFDIMVSLAEK